MKRAIIFVLSLFAAACIPPAQPLAPMTLTTVSSADDYAPYKEAGTATITGQAFLTTRGGDVKVAAGREVTLDSATPLAKEWFTKYGRDTQRWAEAPTDPAFTAARKVAVADAQGKFSFTNLPAGTYIVRTTVTWEVPSGSLYVPDSVQGGVVYALVTVGSGETKNAILNQM